MKRSRNLRQMQRALDIALAKPLPPEDHEAAAVRVMHQNRMAGFDEGRKEDRDRWNESAKPMSALTYNSASAVDIPAFLPRERCIDLISKYGPKIFERARASVAREADIDGIAAACEQLSKGGRR